MVKSFIPKLGVYIKSIALKAYRVILIAVVISTSIHPSLFSLPSNVEKVYAANFQMKSGYYTGNGSSLSITGLGFQPELVIVKSSTTAGVGAFKTSAMPAANTAFFSGAADNTSSLMSLDSDGFTVGTLGALNNLNILYYWVAFAGSDCSVTGNFCVGQYTGDGVATQTISTGFQPDAVIVKRTTAIAGNFRVTSHPANRASYFTTTTDNTAGGLISSFTASGFVVGSAVNNVSGGIYNFFAFKESAGAVKQGSFTGDGLDNRNITGVGFLPDLVIVKNSTSATTGNRNPLMITEDIFGEGAVGLGATSAVTTNTIQNLNSDGFQVGTSGLMNQSGATMYYLAIGGGGSFSTNGNSYSFDSGTFTGTGSSLSITSLNFAPDLVIIKGATAVAGAFKTRVMQGDITAYLGLATADFAQGITSLDANGFTLGTSTVTNTSGVEYQWIAFGNAFNPITNTGSANFAIGVHYGTGIDNKTITKLPFQPAYVAIKRNSTTAGAFKTASHTGEVTSLFSTTADSATDNIQSLTSDGFQVGTNATGNSAGSLYRWFAFKAGSDFVTGTYAGDSTDNRAITGVGFTPGWVTIKRTTAVAGIHRSQEITGDSSQYFVATANSTDRIKSITSGGFTLGTNAEVNQTGGTYYYVCWKGNAPPTVALNTADESVTSDTTPSLDFTGTDENGDDIRYQIQIDSNNTFDSDNSGVVFGDDFNDNFLNPTHWYDNSSGNAVETNQRLEITSTTTSGYYSVLSQDYFDLTGTSYIGEVVSIGNQAIASLSVQPVMLRIDSSNLISFEISDDEVTARIRLAGSSSYFATTSYNATTMKWLRLREQSGNIYWEYSADTSSWSELYSTTAPFDITSLEFAVMIGTDQAETLTTTLAVDNLSIGGSVAPLISAVSGTDAGFANQDTPADTDPFNSGDVVRYTVQGVDELADGLYYWRVRGLDPSGTNTYGDWSAIRSFTILSGVEISIAITTDGNISYGNLSGSESKSTLDLTDTQTVSNTGNVAIDLNIKTTQPSGWTLGATPGVDAFTHEFSINGGSNWTLFTTADSYQTLSTGIAVSGTQNFDLRITAPSSSTSGDQKNITITIQAIEG